MSEAIQDVKGRTPFSSSSSFSCQLPLGLARPLLSFWRFPAIGTEVGWAQLSMCDPGVRRPSVVVVQSYFIPHVCMSNVLVGIHGGSDDAPQCLHLTQEPLQLNPSPFTRRVVWQRLFLFVWKSQSKVHGLLHEFQVDSFPPNWGNVPLGTKRLPT